MSLSEVELYENELRTFTGIGKRIREARIQQKISVEGLAKRLNINRSAVQHWEHSRRYPSAYNALKLSEILGIPLKEICQSRPLRKKPIGAGQLSTKTENVVAKVISV